MNIKFDSELFAHPLNKYKTNLILHKWDDFEDEFIKKLKEYNYQGVVTNPNPDKGFTNNSSNLKDLNSLLEKIQKNNLSYWIYDEAGYPSGQGNGLTLKDHPEYEAKGFYMHRKIAYETMEYTFRLDLESVKIIWAHKCKLLPSRIDESLPDYANYEPVKFSKRSLKCLLNPKEVLFIFCVKNAYEGTHTTHNVSSYKHNINIMDKRAVKRFIDLCYEPIAKTNQEIYQNAIGVFTDEPSLQTHYVRSYEQWNYALLPYVYNLFSEYKKEYREDIYPILPLLFEGEENCFSARVKFHSLIGKLVSKAYTAQIASWCKAHGTSFSGHYLMEEHLYHHVRQYGDFINVIKKVGYPGIDILSCNASTFDFNVPKFVQMAVRKNKTNGMMVELCPFLDLEEFYKDPFNNLIATVSLLSSFGVRVFHSYYLADFVNASKLYFSSTNKRLSKDEAIYFNDYIGRINYLLDNKQNYSSTCIYYPLENEQAHYVPRYRGNWFNEDYVTDVHIRDIALKLLNSGHDFLYIDEEDLKNAYKKKKAVISSNKVKIIIVPEIDVIKRSSLNYLSYLASSGVKVIFINHFPKFLAEDDSLINKEDLKHFQNISADECLANINKNEKYPFSYDSNSGLIVTQYKDGNRNLYYLVNRHSEHISISLLKSGLTILNPSNSSFTNYEKTTSLIVDPYRSLFIF